MNTGEILFTPGNGNGNIITYEILDNDTNDVVYHSNIEDGYIVWEDSTDVIYKEVKRS